MTALDSSIRLFRMGPKASELPKAHEFKISGNNNNWIDAGSFSGLLETPSIQIHIMRIMLKNTAGFDTPLLSFFSAIEKHPFNKDPEKNNNIKTAIESAALKVLSTHSAYLESKRDNDLIAFQRAVEDLKDLVYKHKADSCTKIIDALTAFGQFLLYLTAIVLVSTVIAFMMGALLNNGGITFDSVGLKPLLDALQFADNPITAGVLVGGGIGGAIGLAVGAYQGLREAKSIWTENFNVFFSDPNNSLGTTAFIDEVKDNQEFYNTL